MPLVTLVDFCGRFATKLSLSPITNQSVSLAIISRSMFKPRSRYRSRSKYKSTSCIWECVNNKKTEHFIQPFPRLHTCYNNNVIHYNYSITSNGNGNQTCATTNSNRLFGLSDLSPVGSCHEIAFNSRSRSNYNAFSTLLSMTTCSLLALFCIYFLWKHDYITSFPWITAAVCNSQDDNKIILHFQEKSKGPISSSQTQTDIIYSEVHRRVDETDKLSLSQAVEKAEELLKRKKTESGSPGIVVCVSIDGNYIFTRGFGHSDVENQVPMHPHSVVRIASISKTFAALIIAKLIEEGKLDLDKSIYYYVPTFPEKHFLGEKVDIKVHQLLHHMSGIRHYWTKDDLAISIQPEIDEMISAFYRKTKSVFYSNLKDENSINQEPEVEGKKKEKNMKSKDDEILSTKLYSTTTQALKMFSKDQLMSKPGTKTLYSSFNYTLLTAIVEAVTDEPFTVLAKRTFHQWGLKETYLDQNNPIIYNRARSYQRKNGVLSNTPYIDVSYKWAAGGFLSSVMDVVKVGNIALYSSQHSDQDLGPAGYVKQAIINEMWTASEKTKKLPVKYGSGFFIWSEEKSYGMCSNRSFAVYHSGAAVGASSALAILPRRCPSTRQGHAEKVPKYHITSDPKYASQPSSCLPQTLTSKSAIASSKIDRQLPQGVVVAVFVNLTGVNLTAEAGEIARIFDRVVLD